jgi:hypothetical protein
MALKGGRKIEVEGLAFRWTFKPHRKEPGRAHVAVQEEADRPGQPLVAWIECPEGKRPWFGPKDVRQLIELAMGQGWDPSSRKRFTCPAGIEFRGCVSYFR